MARLPNSDRAVLDHGKLEDYCLNPLHPRGRHKARVFRGALDITRQDAAWLRDVLLEAAGGGDAEEVGADAFGSYWRLDVPISRFGKQAVVRTVWILRKDKDAPRFVTCWVV